MSLTPEQVEAVKREVKKYKEANAEFGKSAINLWNAHLDMAIAMEDPDAIEKALAPTPRGVWGDDNCNCFHPLVPKK